MGERCELQQQLLLCALIQCVLQYCGAVYLCREVESKPQKVIGAGFRRHMLSCAEAAKMKFLRL